MELQRNDGTSICNTLVNRIDLLRQAVSIIYIRRQFIKYRIIVVHFDDVGKTEVL